jgi:carbamate kinase
MRIVAVLGGNAFAPPEGELTMLAQFRFAREALESLAPFFVPEVELVLGHGNGPQVGYMLVRVEEALGKAYSLPLDVCVAETEGELGYVLARTLHEVLAERGVRRSVASLVTQVVVEKDDPAFSHPTKPVGPFYRPEQAREVARAGFVLRADAAGRGLRRVVPSPEPKEILDLDVVRQLLAMGVVVIAAGGGGVPVVRDGGRLRGVEAVIDKDLAAALLAHEVGADRLVILTDVPCAYTDFRTAKEAPLRRITASRARELLAEGHFGAGSMAPKIEACARFARGAGRQAIVCNPASLARALEGEAGTIVVPG